PGSRATGLLTKTFWATRWHGVNPRAKLQPNTLGAQLIDLGPLAYATRRTTQTVGGTTTTTERTSYLLERTDVSTNYHDKNQLRNITLLLSFGMNECYWEGGGAEQNAAAEACRRGEGTRLNIEKSVFSLLLNP
ncbi:MAG: hypothetical protein HYY62_07720, partial [Deltaproteobacteria bacterium]|nr:hypothetical protein [Deltaproteobacteria bacterium]